MNDKDTDTFDYATFEKDTFQVWTWRIQTSFYTINQEILKHTKKELKTPSFAIKEHLDNNWGTWEPVNRVISLNLKLLKNFEWGAVERILRHEIAHMIVDEILDGNGRPHGELFKLACEIVGVPPNRLTSEEMLVGFKGSTFNPTADKVRKLMIHGNNEACTKEEAEVFLDKAQELMIRHNLKLTDINGNERVFVRRPVGPRFNRHPIWLWDLASIVINSCNVQGIMINNANSVRIELYGEPNNLDVAEYIFCALIIQGQYLYKNYLANHQANLQEEKKIKQKKIHDLKRQPRIWNGEQKATDPDPYYADYNYKTKVTKPSVPKPSSASFLSGLYHGYASKMSLDRKDVFAKISAEEGKIITTTNDKMLREMYEKEYNPKTTAGRCLNVNSHYMNGQNAGRNLTLSKGVGSTSNSSGRSLGTSATLCLT